MTKHARSSARLLDRFDPLRVEIRTGDSCWERRRLQHHSDGDALRVPLQQIRDRRIIDFPGLFGVHDRGRSPFQRNCRALRCEKLAPKSRRAALFLVSIADRCRRAGTGCGCSCATWPAEGSRPYDGRLHRPTGIGEATSEPRQSTDHGKLMPAGRKRTLATRGLAGLFFAQILGSANRFAKSQLKSLWKKVLENVGSPGLIRTGDHSINSRMLYR